MTNRSPPASQSLDLTTVALAGPDHALCVGNIWISDEKMQFKTLDLDLALEHTKEMPAIFNKKTADRCGSENP